jgi:hypothetical protein
VRWGRIVRNPARGQRRRREPRRSRHRPPR